MVFHSDGFEGTLHKNILLKRADIRFCHGFMHEKA